MDSPFTVTKADGTVIQLKWKKKKEKRPIVYKKINTPENNSINKCLTFTPHHLYVDPSLNVLRNNETHYAQQRSTAHRKGVGKPKKKVSEDEYILKTLKQIKKDLELKNIFTFKFYEFKEIQLLSIKENKSCGICDLRCECGREKTTNIYTLNLNKMMPTTNSKIKKGISEKIVSRLKNIVSCIEITNKTFIL